MEDITTGADAPNSQDLEEQWPQNFTPPNWLLNGHMMTIVPAMLPRGFVSLRREAKGCLVDVSHDSKVLVQKHGFEDAKQKAEKPTLVIFHGLEGSADAPYVLGLAKKARKRDWNVVRVNMRNCGGTMHLTPTLYNGGLSGDAIAILKHLKEEGCEHVFLCGTSLGGNLVMKAAAELKDEWRELLKGVCAISPSLDLEAAVVSLNLPKNRIYEKRFLLGLKQKIRDKARLYPGKLDTSLLKSMTSVRDFDDLYTAPDGGYLSAKDYYYKASAIRILEDVRVPSMILAAQDDPIVPFETFTSAKLSNNPAIRLVAPRHGGHGGFFHRDRGNHDRFWSEDATVEFFHQQFVRNDG